MVMRYRHLCSAVRGFLFEVDDQAFSYCFVDRNVNCPSSGTRLLYHGILLAVA